jgi:hypothetical protein
MNNEVIASDFEGLLSRLTENGLTELELQQLGALIEKDSELRLQYLDYCQIHGLLRAEHGLL